MLLEHLMDNGEVRKVNGRHVRWIDKKSGYSSHGEYVTDTFWGKCLVQDRYGNWYRLDGDDLEWYYAECQSIQPVAKVPLLQRLLP